MIWLNLKELENRIITEKYSDKEGFYYFLGSSILGVLGMYLHTSEGLIALAEVTLGVAVTIWGSILVFKTNAAGDGKDFFKRYFALSWVIGWRLFLIAMVVVFILSMLLIPFAPGEFEVETNIKSAVSIAIPPVVALLFYRILNQSFKRVSRK